jgi:hypothetical protein
MGKLVYCLLEVFISSTVNAFIPLLLEIILSNKLELFATELNLLIIIIIKTSTLELILLNKLKL